MCISGNEPSKTVFVDVVHPSCTPYCCDCSKFMFSAFSIYGCASLITPDALWFSSRHLIIFILILGVLRIQQNVVWSHAVHYCLFPELRLIIMASIHVLRHIPVNGRCCKLNWSWTVECWTWTKWSWNDNVKFDVLMTLLKLNCWMLNGEVEMTNLMLK